MDASCDSIDYRSRPRCGVRSRYNDDDYYYDNNACSHNNTGSHDYSFSEWTD